MKTFVFLLVAALLAGGSVLLYLERQTPAPEPETLDAALTPEDQTAEGSGPSSFEVAITVLAGALDVALSTGEQKTVTGQTRAPVAAVIKTPAGSRADLEFPDGSRARIDERTEIKILALQKDGAPAVSVRLTAGRMFSRVKQLLGGSRYEVRTSNTLATVRGTGFDVVRIGSKTKVVGLEDVVIVAGLDPATETPIPGLPAVSVGVLQTVTLDEAAPPTPEKLPEPRDVRAEEIQIDPWLIFNMKKEASTGKPLPGIPGLKLDIPTPEPTGSPRRRGEPSPTPSPSPRLVVTPSPIPPIPAAPPPLATPTAMPTPTPARSPSPPAAKLSITQVSPETVGVRSEDFPFRIFGSGFTPGARALIGAIPLKNVAVQSSTEITALIPRGTPPAAYEVIVINPDGERTVLGGGVFAVAEFQ